MGKGDKRTRKGKINNKSYGKSRKHKTTKVSCSFEKKIQIKQRIKIFDTKIKIEKVMDISEELLIQKGFFPENLPPPFTSSFFATIVKDIVTDIDNYDPLEPKNKRKFSKTLYYTAPKLKMSRRVFGITHPLLQTRLANTIVKNWTDIKSFTDKSLISLTRLNVDSSNSATKVFEKLDFAKKDELRVLRSSGCRYLLRCDITRFYPSIYTHSIPWALHTKEIAKKKEGRKREDYFGNAIDEDLRRMQDQQTMGIPIGQETSRIVSEIIAVAIEEQIGLELKGIREIDDFYLYFNSIAELEKVLALLNNSVTSYELGLNYAKQKILQLPEITEEKWVYKLRNFIFNTDIKHQRKELIQYFNLAFQFTEKYVDEYVLRYAIKRFFSHQIHPDNWDMLEEFLMKTLIIEAKTIDYVADLLIKHRNYGFDINKIKIKNILEDILDYNLNLGNIFEVSWILWLLTKLEISLSQKFNDRISKVQNSVVALVALDMRESGFIEGILDTQTWENFLNSEELFAENWLLAYESVKQGWLTPKTSYFNSDPFFELLDMKDIIFYDKTKGLDSRLADDYGEIMFYYDDNETATNEDNSNNNEKLPF